MPFSLAGETLQLRIRYYLFPVGTTGRDAVSSGPRPRASPPLERTGPRALESVRVSPEDETPEVGRQDPRGRGHRRATPADADGTVHGGPDGNPPERLDAIRLEEEVVSFLNDWEDLRHDNDLIKEAILRSNSGRSTGQLAQRISRALELRGFTAVHVDAGPRRAGHVGGAKASDLLDDPDTMAGPEQVSVIRGRTTGIHFSLNGADGFVPRRTPLRVECDHLDIDADHDVAVGELRNGRLRVSVAVPPDADPGNAS